MAFCKQYLRADATNNGWPDAHSLVKVRSTFGRHQYIIKTTCMLPILRAASSRRRDRGMEPVSLSTKRYELFVHLAIDICLHETDFAHDAAL